MRQFLRMLTLATVTCMSTWTLSAQNGFTETFGQHTTRQTSPFLPSPAVGPKFIFALPGGTNNEKRIENDHYAVVDPNYIWETGFSASSDTWYWWTIPSHGWGGSTPSNYPSDYPSAASDPDDRFIGRTIDDHTVGDVNGAVMVVNAGNTIAPFYQRNVRIFRGQTYTVSFWVYMVQPSSGIAVDIWDAGIAPTTSTPTISTPGYLGGFTTGLLTTSSPSYRNWQEYSYEITLPNTCDVDSSITVTVYFKNSHALPAGNDYYIDDISVSAAPAPIGGGVTLSCPTSASFDLSGNVFHDGKPKAAGVIDTYTGDLVLNNNGALDAATYVSLVEYVNGHPNILGTFPVNADGSYLIDKVLNGTYDIVIHNNPAGAASAQLTSGWISTGEGANATKDLTANGIVSVVVTGADLSDINFGVQQIPVVDAKNINLTYVPTLGSTLNFGGSGELVSLSGTDNEDAPSSPITVVFTSLPTNGTLHYNGVPAVANTDIVAFDITLLTLELTGSGYDTTQFEYAYKDEAGALSEPKPYHISWAASLPLHLISFKAIARSLGVLITWEIAAAKDINGYEVQRSKDGSEWDILTYQAVANTQETTGYSFTDEHPTSGNNYYRLKQINVNGKSFISPTRIVHFGTLGNTAVTLYPNPAQNQLVINSERIISTMSIYNAMGSAVLELHPNVNELNLDIHQLPAGQYLVVITTLNGTTNTYKVSKIDL